MLLSFHVCLGRPRPQVTPFHPLPPPRLSLHLSRGAQPAHPSQVLVPVPVPSAPPSAVPVCIHGRIGSRIPARAAHPGLQAPGARCSLPPFPRSLPAAGQMGRRCEVRGSGFTISNAASPRRASLAYVRGTAVYIYTRGAYKHHPPLCLASARLPMLGARPRSPTCPPGEAGSRPPTRPSPLAPRPHGSAGRGGGPPERPGRSGATGGRPLPTAARRGAPGAAGGTAGSRGAGGGGGGAGSLAGHPAATAALLPHRLPPADPARRQRARHPPGPQPVR